jgi:beta-lactamase class A
MTDPEGTAALRERLAVLLEALGGETALVAERVATPALPRRAHRDMSRTAESDDDHDQHDHHGRAAIAAAGASGEGRVALREDLVVPAASLAKLPIAVEVMRRASLGQFDLAETLDTADEPRVGGGGVLDYLDPRVRLTLNDLCFLMLGISDNTAANFLLDLVGMGEVNETLSRMGLTRTRLARHFMDSAARAARRENVTCADDMVRLLALIRGGALPGATRLLDWLAAQQCADDISAWLPPAAQLGHKTGSLDGVFHDAGILAGPGGICVFCVLTAGQTEIPAARLATGEIVRALWDAWCAGPA